MMVVAPVRGLVIGRIEGELKRLPTIYINKGECPFECCQYRTWKVEKDANLYNKPSGKKIVGTITKGDSVEGLTGQVESRPLLVTATADHVDGDGNKFSKGDKFYLLTNRGEGFFLAWFSGRLFNMGCFGIENFCGENTNWATTKQTYKHVWWKRIKTREGIEGWTKEDVFSNQDACG